MLPPVAEQDMSARIMTSLLRRAVLLQIETMAQRFSCRRATAADADAIAAVFSSSFRLLTFLPMLHTAEEDRQFIETVLERDEVSVADSADRIASFLSRDGEEIGLLYTHPDFIGSGAGGLLLDHTKASGVAALELWCFQANAGACRFYERHGFRAIRLTDGQDNEEKMPDVRYRWQR
jgi:GNAT superfamily N-acetyltransferase